MHLGTQWRHNGAQAPALFKPHDGLVNSVVSHLRESTALRHHAENLQGEHCTALHHHAVDLQGEH